MQATMDYFPGDLYENVTFPMNGSLPATTKVKEGFALLENKAATWKSSVQVKNFHFQEIDEIFMRCLFKCFAGEDLNDHGKFVKWSSIFVLSSGKFYNHQSFNNYSEIFVNNAGNIVDVPKNFVNSIENFGNLENLIANYGSFLHYIRNERKHLNCIDKGS